MKQIVLLCGVPYCGKTTFLKKTNAPCIIMDEFLQKRYKTDSQKTVEMRLSQEGHQRAFADIAKEAVQKARESESEAPFFIEWTFTLRHERTEMLAALKASGAEDIDCICLDGIPFEELFKRCCDSERKFKYPMDVLMDRCKRLELPAKWEGFNEVVILQPKNGGGSSTAE